MATIGNRLLIGTDMQGSVFLAVASSGRLARAYSPYGYCSLDLHPEYGGRIQFAGELRDRFTGCYTLGNGYRGYHPELKRFGSPDSLSPFGDGGLSTYAYCRGDPVNRIDPSGHVGVASALQLLHPLRSRFSPSPVTKPMQLRKVLYPDMQDVKIYGDAFSFSDKNGTRYNLVTHGDGKKALLGGQILTPSELHADLLARGETFGGYSEARLISCHGADHGKRSPGQQFATLSGLRTKTYLGIVRHNMDPVIQISSRLDDPVAKAALIRLTFQVTKYYPQGSTRGSRSATGRHNHGPLNHRSVQFLP